MVAELPSEDVKRRRQPTMADVAELAQVGASTVSRVLRGDTRVSPATKERILWAVGHVGYRVDSVARSLRTQRTASAGFVVSDLANPVFSAIAAAAERTFSDLGYTMFVASHGHLAEREALVLEGLLGKRVDGMILSSPSDLPPSLAISLRDEGIPVVLLDRESPRRSFDRVVVDHYAGTRAALLHLTMKGHRRVLLIERPLDIAPGRWARRAARDTSVELHGAVEILFRPGPMSEERAYAELLEALDSTHPPTAVVASSNQLLAGVLDGLRDRRIRIGTDISVIGTDDSSLAQLLGLTALHRDLAEMGRTAAQIVVHRIRGELGRKPKKVVLPLTLEMRDSVGSPRDDSASRTARVQTGGETGRRRQGAS